MRQGDRLDCPQGKGDLRWRLAGRRLRSAPTKTLQIDIAAAHACLFPARTIPCMKEVHLPADIKTLLFAGVQRLHVIDFDDGTSLRMDMRTETWRLLPDFPLAAASTPSDEEVKPESRWLALQLAEAELLKSTSRMGQQDMAPVAYNVHVSCRRQSLSLVSAAGTLH